MQIRVLALEPKPRLCRWVQQHGVFRAQHRPDLVGRRVLGRVSASTAAVNARRRCDADSSLRVGVGHAAGADVSTQA